MMARSRLLCRSQVSSGRFVLSLVVLVATLLLSLPVHAQSLSGCTPPQSISDDVATFSAFARLAADQYDQLHLVWSSGVEPGRNEEQVETDTIYYVTGSHDNWSEPVDILTDPVYASAEKILTSGDRLLILWRSRDRLYLSEAPLWGAASAKSWQIQELAIGSITDADMFLSSNSVLHVAYTYNQAALGEGYIGYLRSDDAGVSWTQLAQLSPVNAQDVVNTRVQVFEHKGFTHVTWSQTTRDNRWSPVNIWYSRSADGGVTWDDPTEIFSGPGASYPGISRGADSILYMTWIRSVGYGDSKYIRYSTDNGYNWSEPTLLFEEYRGLNGRVTILTDSGFGEHLIMGGDVRNVGTTAIWYSQHESGGWTFPLMLSTGLRDSEFAEAVITHGNQLHVVWNDFIEDDIYHVACTLNAPAVASMVSVTPTSAPLPTSTPESSLTNGVSATAEAPVSPYNGEPAPETSSRSELLPLLLGLIPVVLLVGIVMLRRRLHER